MLIDRSSEFKSLRPKQKHSVVHKFPTKEPLTLTLIKIITSKNFNKILKLKDVESNKYLIQNVKQRIKYDLIEEIKNKNKNLLKMAIDESMESLKKSYYESLKEMEIEKAEILRKKYLMMESKFKLIL